MRVDDEIFYLDREDTMFNLRNGGGKSVLVQMIMAPFVNKKHRNLKDRTFESYFNSSIPTYILVEWKLDNEAGYVLTGMMVRKKEVISDEDSKDKLDIINFIHEYKNKNQYDIENIPVIEEVSGKRKIKSFVNSKKIFEELKKDKNYDFNYYDMGISVTASAYFSRLLIYDINHKEWEGIIKKINLKESGLSELFSNAKNVEGLVKEWFLPAVENKLTKDENRIKNYRELINRYIKQYKENKSNIDKKEKIELFNKLSEEVKETIKELLHIIDDREILENEIANIIIYLDSELKKHITEEEDLNKLIIDINNEIKELKYEEKSLELYEKLDEKEELNKDFQVNEENISESNLKINDLEKKKNIFTCAKLYMEYTECSRELQGLEIERDILKKKNKDAAPLIENLGFTIKNIINKEISDLNEKEANRIKIIKDLNEEKKSREEILKKDRISINSLSKNEGSLNSTVEFFNKEEEKFNKHYSENLKRNIEGLLDEEALLNIEKTIDDKSIKLSKEIKECGEGLLKSKEKLKALYSERDISNRKIIEADRDLNEKNKELEKINNELELRKEILKYIGFNEDMIFEREKILLAFDNKISLINDKQRKIKNILENIKEEIIKLETGKILELPKELEYELKKRDISIIYGMEWLKKNGLSEKENIEIIKKNPFIPYSLIMDSKQVEILKKEPLNIFTSTPIVIVKRESIKANIASDNENVINFDGIDFFISFNKKLLSEEELKRLIQEKKQEVEEKELQLIEVEKDLKLYTDKKSIIQLSSLTSNSYDSLKIDIEKLKDEKVSLLEEEIKIKKEISKTEEEIKNFDEDKTRLQNMLNLNNNKMSAFKDFRQEYDIYKKNKIKLEEVKERIRMTAKAIEDSEKKIVDIEEKLKEFEKIVNSYREEKKSHINEINRYSMYKSGEIIKKDKEDLVAEYDTLTKEISSTEEELNKKIEKANGKFNNAQNNLYIKSEQYNLSESDYIEVKYSIYEELEIEENLKSEEKKLKEQEQLSSGLGEKIAVCNNEINSKLKRIKEDFNVEVPKEKSLIFERNYKEESAKLYGKIDDTKNSKEKVIKLINKLDKNLDNLKEYNDLKVIEEIDINLDFKNLSDIIGRKRRDLRNLKEEQSNKLNEVAREINNKFGNNNEFKYDVTFKTAIQTLDKLVMTPRKLLEQLNIIQESYKMLMEKLLYDIDIINKEENKILESLLEYISDVNDNLAQIDNNSTINIKDKRVKMLNILVPNWDENKEVYRIKLKDYIEQLRDQCLVSLEKNESIEELISNRINIYKLYNEVVSVSNINIKLYKIEEDKQRQISWNEVSINSGGEGFLSAFVILSSLLSYTRKDNRDIFNRSESGKVLIMDNPFAQTSSVHLLKPLMDIAKKSNTQLICFTGLGGDSIYNRFDNIYVLNLVQSKLKSGTKYLKGDHVKGEEDKEEIVSSRLKIEEQVRLF